MSSDHASPSRSALQATLASIMALAATAWGLAAQDRPFTVQVENLSGHVAASYYFSVHHGSTVRYGGEGGILRGATLSGAVEADLGDLQIELQANDLQPTRQQLDLRVRAGNYDGRVDLSNVPPAGENDERAVRAAVRQSYRFESGPRASLSGSWRRRGDTSSHFSVSGALSQRHRDVAPGVGAIAWNTGYTFSRRASQGRGDRERHGLRVRVDGDLTGDDERSVKPSMAASWSWDAAGLAELGHRYQLGLEVEAREAETLAYRLDLDLASGRRARTRHRLDVERQVHDRVAVRADAEARGDGGAPAFDFGGGVTVEPVENLELLAGYRGRHDQGTTRHGVDGGARWQLRARPWSASLRADGDVLFGPDDTSSSLRLSAQGRYRGETLSGSARASLTHRKARTSGRLELSAELDRDDLVASLSSGLALARDLAARTELQGRVPIGSAVWLQGRGEYRASFAEDGGNVLTLGLGLRYDFGGAP